MVNSGVFPIPTPYGGAENHVYYLSKELARLGHEVHVVSDVSPECDLKNMKNISITPVNLPDLKLFSKGFYGYALRHLLGGIYSAKRAFSCMKEHDIGIVHVHGRIAPFILSKFIKSLPVVFTLHDDPPDKHQNRYILYKLSFLIQAKSAENSSHIIVVHSTQKYYLKNFNIPEDKVTYIPNGVDIYKFKPEYPKDNYCIYVGSLTKRKGVEYLLHALKHLDIRCYIVGDGPERNNLENLSEKLSLSNVEFMGAVPLGKISELLSKAQFFILPSIREGMPLSILEAMASGCPVIATNISGIPEIVRNGYNGFLVEPGNVKQLREKINILHNDHDLCINMGKNARNFIKERFSWRKTAEKLVEVYKTVYYYN